MQLHCKWHFNDTHTALIREKMDAVLKTTVYSGMADLLNSKRSKIGWTFVFFSWGSSNFYKQIQMEGGSAHFLPQASFSDSWADAAGT